MKNLTRKQQVLVVINIIFISVFFGTMLLSRFVNPFPTIDPEVIDWVPLNITHSQFTNHPWGNILEAKYSISSHDLYFLVKWNGRVPSTSGMENLTGPWYNIHRRAYIKWILGSDGKNVSFQGVLLVGSENFVLFKFIKREPDFEYSQNAAPFANETTAVFKVFHTGKSDLSDSLLEISVEPATEYIFLTPFLSHLHSLSDIPDSSANSINLDGDLSDWYNSTVNKTIMNIPTLVISEELSLPYYQDIYVTRTTEGIYTAVTFSNNNFTRSLIEQGNLSINIYWVTVLAVINGTYAADYAFESFLSFNRIDGYSVQNVSITLNAGTGFSPSITEFWQLQTDQQGTDACLESFFPHPTLPSNSEKFENLYFYSSITIEFIPF